MIVRDIIAYDPYKGHNKWDSTECNGSNPK